MTPILARPSDQPVSTNMHRSGRSCLVQDSTAFRGAGSADTAVLIEGICEGNLVVYLVTRTGRDLSLMTPSLPSSSLLRLDGKARCLSPYLPERVLELTKTVNECYGLVWPLDSLS